MTEDLQYARFEESDRHALAAAMAQAFNSSAKSIQEWWEKTGVENLRVVRAGATTVGGLVLIPMGQFFGGERLETHGVAGVAVAPEARGRGVARSLMREALREMRERGVALSTLYASTVPLYASLGYGRAGESRSARIHARDIPRARGPGTVRAIVDADGPAIEEAYRRFAAAFDGHLDRGAYAWTRIRHPRSRIARGYLIEGETGVEGYVYFHNQEDSGFEELTLADWCATTREGFATVLALLADQATMWRELVWTARSRDPLLAAIPDRWWRLKVEDHWLLRLVDVSRALGERGYACGLRAELHLEVDDDVLAENRGRFIVRVADGRAEVEPGGEGKVRTDAASLAGLFSGMASAEQLSLLGRAEGAPSELAKASAIFAGAPSMVDFF